MEPQFPQFPVPEKLPRIPPGFFDWKLWSVLVFDVCMVMFNLYTAHRNASRGATISLAMDCVGTTVCLAACAILARILIRYWQQWQSARAIMEDLTLQIEAHNAAVRRGN